MTAAAADLYFANMGVITVTPPGGAAQTLAMVKNITATFKQTEVYAWAWGSKLIQGRAAHSAQVDVEIETIKFAPQVSTWWPFYITDPTAGGGTVIDTNTVALFSVTAEFVPLGATGAVKLLRTITNVSFPEFPLVANENQFIPIKLKGVGQTFVDTNPA
jgi:hypothetical protein